MRPLAGSWALTRNGPSLGRQGAGPDVRLTDSPRLSPERTPRHAPRSHHRTLYQPVRAPTWLKTWSEALSTKPTMIIVGVTALKIKSSLAAASVSPVENYTYHIQSVSLPKVDNVYLKFSSTNRFSSTRWISMEINRSSAGLDNISTPKNDFPSSSPGDSFTNGMHSMPDEGAVNLLVDLPASVQSLLLNIILIFVTIYLSNASDYLRSVVHKNPDLRFRPLLRLVTDMPESTIAVIAGMILGFILSEGFSIRAHFSEEVFFYFILPPIIFYQGYSLKKRNFFRYFHYIFTLGVVGTLMHMGVVALALIFLNKAWISLGLPLVGWDDVTKGQALEINDILLLSSVLSSADEVAALAMVNKDDHPKLSALLFGEGVLNDAVSILLFRSVLRGDADSSFYAVTVAYTAIFLLFSSTLIGLAVGLGISRLLKVNTGLNDHPTRQTIIIVLGCYVSYAVAELLDVNGVLSVFVCGIIFSHFAWHCLAPEAKIGTAIFSRSLSQIAEIYSFTALGLSVYRFHTRDFSLRYLCVSVMSMGLARACVVFGLFGLVVYCDRENDSASPWKDQLVLFGAGLVRGAITWAQALQLPGKNRKVLISTTLQVISFTLVVVGGALPSMLRALGMGETDSLEAPEMVGVAEAVSDSGYDVEGDINNGETPPCFSRATSSEDVRPLLNRDDSFGRKGGRSYRAAPKDAHLSPIPDAPPLLRGGSIEPSMVLKGRVHRLWAHIDETLKPFFGGRSRLPAPGGSYISSAEGCYMSTATLRSAQSYYGSTAPNALNSGPDVKRPDGQYGKTKGSTGASNNSAVDPQALKASFKSSGFKVPTRILSKLANQKPDGSSVEPKKTSSRKLGPSKK